MKQVKQKRKRLNKQHQPAPQKEGTERKESLPSWAIITDEEREAARKDLQSGQNVASLPT